MIEYKLKKGNILKDGHTMFLQDVVKELNRKAYLENLKEKEAPMSGPFSVGLDAQLAKTTITMFINFIQCKGAWPCILEMGEQPKVIPAEEVMKMKDEFVAKMCN
jgi:hypothetical protein